jgi:hypothetical protein
MNDSDIENKDLIINFKNIFTLFLFFNLTSVIALYLRPQLIGLIQGYSTWIFKVNQIIEVQGITNTWFQYPQGIQLILYGIYKFSFYLSLVFLKIFQNTETFSHLSLFNAVYMILLFFVPHILTFVLIYLIGKEFSEKIGIYASLAYAFFWIPFYYSILINYPYDPFPLFLLLGGIYFVLKKRVNHSAILIALGATVKIFPILLFLPAIKYIKNRNVKFKFSITFIAVLLVIFLPFIIANKDIFLSTYYWQNGRPPWGSWYMILAYIIDAPCNYSQPYYLGNISTGWIYWGLQPNLNTLITPVPKQPTQWWNLLSLAGMAVSFLPVVLTRIENKKQLIDWSLYIITAFMFWNIGWSPQYVMYLLPLLIFLFIDRLQDGIYLAMFLQILVILGYPVLLPLAMRGDMVFIIWYSLVVLARYAIFIYIMAVIVKRYSGGYAVGNILK